MKSLAISMAGAAAGITFSFIAGYAHQLDAWWAEVVEFWGHALAILASAVALVYFGFWLYDIS